MGLDRYTPADRENEWRRSVRLARPNPSSASPPDGPTANSISFCHSTTTPAERPRLGAYERPRLGAYPPADQHSRLGRPTGRPFCRLFPSESPPSKSEDLLARSVQARQEGIRRALTGGNHRSAKQLQNFSLSKLRDDSLPAWGAYLTRGLPS